MPARAPRFLASTIFALAVLMIASASGGPRTTATNYNSTVTSEVICNPSTPSPIASPIGVASPSPVAIEFDQIYLDLMIAQKTRLIRMALVALDGASAPEVQQLSQQIGDSTQPVLERLQDTRDAWFDGLPVLQAAEVMSALDELARQQPAVGGVPGAMEIIQGEGVVAELCDERFLNDFDVHFLTALIGQLENGLLLSEAAMQLAGRDETKIIAALVVETDQPLKDSAVAFRDLLLQGSPIPADH